jgi:hypothetical protein
MTDSKKDSEEDAKPQDLLSRRKLVYAAPVLMTKRMFYRASACNKLGHLGHGSCGAPTKDS